MGVELHIRNTSSHKRFYTRPALQRLADSVCAGEGVSGRLELSVLFCDDETIRSLNRKYRGKNRPTDVLSFQQDGPAGPVRALGDVVISLDTVWNRFKDDSSSMRAEVRLLLCHGLLHLLGYRHHSLRDRRLMAKKQAQYLGLPIEEAWPEQIAAYSSGAPEKRRPS